MVIFATDPFPGSFFFYFYKKKADETRLSEFTHKHFMNKICNHVWFHHALKIKIIL